MAESELKELVLQALSRVQDPELHQDLVSLKMVKNVAVCDGVVKVDVELTTPACPMKGPIRDDIVREVMRVPGVRQVKVEFSAAVRGGAAGPLAGALPGVKNVLAVGAGKGGVGKSFVAVSVAVGLAREGATVGLLDADVYGPSIPTMLGLADEYPLVRDERIVPIAWTDARGRTVKVISVGFMVPAGAAVIWRGPMVHGLIRQFLGQVDWGKLDYLVIDLPPGTGDVPLTLSQSIPLTGAVVVATPQELALMDARRAVRMYREMGVECLGLVENMSYYLCPGCGRQEDLFGRGGAEQAARELGVPFLGAVPISTAVRVHGDQGRPEMIFDDPQIGPALTALVRNLAGQISVRNVLEPFSPSPAATAAKRKHRQ